MKEIQAILKNIKKKEPVSVGDVVYGRIVVLKEKIAVVNLDYADNNKVLSPAESGVVFISNVAQGYVKKIDDFYNKGDIIKAKVIEITPYEYKLTTAEKNLGVIKGLCNNCKQELSNTPDASQIRCFNCGTIQSKKFVKVGE